MGMALSAACCPQENARSSSLLGLVCVKALPLGLQGCQASKLTLKIVFSCIGLNFLNTVKFLFAFAWFSLPSQVRCLLWLVGELAPGACALSS